MYIRGDQITTEVRRGTTITLLRPSVTEKDTLEEPGIMFVKTRSEVVGKTSRPEDMRLKGL